MKIKEKHHDTGQTTQQRTLGLCNLLCHWYAIRIWLALCLLLALIFHLSSLPRHFHHIVDSGVLRVGYFKSPDIAYQTLGKHYGYEYQIIQQFAKQHQLTIHLVPMNRDKLHQALNLNKIDIAIGGFIKRNTDSRLFQASTAFESQTVIAIEKRQNNIAASTTVKFPIHFGKRLHNLPTDQLSITSIDSPEEELTLFDKLSDGDIQLVGTTLARLRMLQRFYPNLRRVKTLKNLRVELVWLFGKRVNPSFSTQINQFLKQPETRELIQQLQTDAYKRPDALHYLDLLKLDEHRQTRLPKFERWFKQASNEYGIDWFTLAAMAYQESKWVVDAVSPTNVRGIMQMTTKTASALGIENRLDPYSTIFGAANYVKNLEKRVPKRVTGEDRTLIAIAAYNIGFGNIIKAYRMARKGNIQAITWNDIAKQLPKLRVNARAEPIVSTTEKSETFPNETYTRGIQAVNYVERVKEFSEILRYYAAD